MSVTRNNGLEGVSINNIFVVGRIACTIESVCVVSTKSTSIPNRVNTLSMRDKYRRIHLNLK